MSQLDPEAPGYTFNTDRNAVGLPGTLNEANPEERGTLSVLLFSSTHYLFY